MRTRLVLLLMLVCAGLAAGQEDPKPLYSDAIDRVLCDEFKARLDALMIEVGYHPGSLALIAISEQPEPLRSLYLESLVTGSMSDRNYDLSRLKIIRAAKHSSEMRLWVIPAGATLPAVEPKSWDLSVALPKPLLFYADNGLFDAICSFGSLNEHFAEILFANSAYRGNIVIREPTDRRFRRHRTAIRRHLASVPLSRLRFFFVRSKGSGFEYWLVPPRNRK